MDHAHHIRHWSHTHGLCCFRDNESRIQELIGCFHSLLALIGCFHSLLALIGCFHSLLALIGCFRSLLALVGCFHFSLGTIGRFHSLLAQLDAFFLSWHNWLLWWHCVLPILNFVLLSSLCHSANVCLHICIYGLCVCLYLKTIRINVHMVLPDPGF